MSRTARRKQRRNRIIVAVIVAILAAVLVGTGILAITGSFSNGSTAKSGPETTNGMQEPDETTGEGQTETTGMPGSSEGEVTLVAVGDIIGHDTILEIGKTDSGYDFTDLFEKLKPDVKTANLAVANMETPFGGGESGPYVGYPSFNTPDEMGIAIMDAGFNVVQLASNHSMDSGITGLQHEIGFWNRYKDNVLAVGVNESEEDRNTIKVVDMNGITFAFLNYTYGLNGYELPDDRQYMITLLADENRDFIVSQIEQANEYADVVVVLPHWGTEYVVGEPTDEQKQWAEAFTAAGADLIIGTHPHVIEKADWVEAGTNRALCYYSLGNFVSNQQGTDTVLGGMAYVKFKKDGENTVIDEELAKVIPLVTHNDKTGEKTVIQTYYLADYDDSLAEVHDTKLNSEDPSDADFSVATLRKKAENTFGKAWLKDRIN